MLHLMIHKNSRDPLSPHVNNEIVHPESEDPLSWFQSIRSVRQALTLREEWTLLARRHQTWFRGLGVF